MLKKDNLLMRRGPTPVQDRPLFLLLGWHQTPPTSPKPGLAVEIPPPALGRESAPVPVPQSRTCAHTQALSRKGYRGHMSRPEPALARSGGAAAGQRPLEVFGTGRPRVGHRVVNGTWRRHALAPPASDGVRYPLHPACEQVGGRGKSVRCLTIHDVVSAGLVTGPERRRLRGLSWQVRRTKIKLSHRRGRVVASAVCYSRSQELVSRRDRRSEIIWRGRLAPLLGRFLLCPLLLALPRALALGRPAAILAACGRGSRSTWQIIVNFRSAPRITHARQTQCVPTWTRTLNHDPVAHHSPFGRRVFWRLTKKRCLWARVAETAWRTKLSAQRQAPQAAGCGAVEAAGSPAALQWQRARRAASSRAHDEGSSPPAVYLFRAPRRPAPGGAAPDVMRWPLETGLLGGLPILPLDGHQGLSLPAMPSAFARGPSPSPKFCAACARNSASRPDAPVPYGTLRGAGLRETHRARWSSCAGRPCSATCAAGR